MPILQLHCLDTAAGEASSARTSENHAPVLQDVVAASQHCTTHT